MIKSTRVEKQVIKRKAFSLLGWEFQRISKRCWFSEPISVFVYCKHDRRMKEHNTDHSNNSLRMRNVRKGTGLAGDPTSDTLQA